MIRLVCTINVGVFNRELVLYPKNSSAFCTYADASGWDSLALKAVFFKSMNEKRKDELATQEEPKRKNKVIALATRIDIRRNERRKHRRENPTDVETHYTVSCSCGALA